jgi:hypothetical protein
MSPEVISLSIMPALGALALGFTVWAERYLLPEIKPRRVEHTTEIPPAEHSPPDTL